MKNSIKLTWLLIPLGIAYVGILIAASMILEIGDRLGTISRLLEISFYLVSIGIVAFCIGYPVLRVFLAPHLPPFGDVEKATDKEIELLAKRFCRTTALGSETVNLQYILTKGGDPRNEVRTICAKLNDEADKLIYSQATLVAIYTALSQSKTLDNLILLRTNLDLIRRIVETYGYRPNTAQLLRIYGTVLVASVTINDLAEIATEEVILLQSSIKITGKIPFVRALTSSLANGVTNAAFTIFVGLLTKQLITHGKFSITREVRRTLRKQSIVHCKEVAKCAVDAVNDAAFNSGLNLFRVNVSAEAN